MARALLGYVGSTNNEPILAMEIARLRRRVAELETELAELRASQHAELDLELHRIAETAEAAALLPTLDRSPMARSPSTSARGPRPARRAVFGTVPAPQ